ncbi:MAG: zinc-dependent alcohol dehydrogenase [Phycisphaerae bacterium]
MKALIFNIRPAGWLACKLLRPVWPGVVRSFPGGLKLVETDPPSLPGEDWVRVGPLLAGICGTDTAIVAQKQRPDSILQAFSSMPMGFGHENVSVVESVGPGVDDSWVGRRVCVEPTLSCRPRGIEPMCGPCSEGRFGACENFGAAGKGSCGLPAGTSIGYNARTGGAYGQAFVAHESQLVAVPESIPDELAVLTDPLACSLHGVLSSRWQEMEHVLVYGCGTLGLGAIAALRAVGFGGCIDAVSRPGRAAELARSFGVDEVLLLPRAAEQRFETVARRTGCTVKRARFGNRILAGGYDAVFDCVGSNRSLSESLKWTAARGECILVGTGDGVGVDMTAIWFRELTVKGIYGRAEERWDDRTIGTYQLVHELMVAGKLDVAAMLTHTFELEAWPEAMKTAMNKSSHGAVKVAFDFRKMKE